jgi:HEAT repeat protein
MRAVLQSRIAKLSPNPPAILHAALGALDGEIPDDVAIQLLASSSVEHRLAAAHWASGPKGLERLRILLDRDPAPEVRAAAVRRLVQLESKSALRDAARSLDDPAPSVRLAAAQSVAALGPDAIPALRYIVESGTPDGAKAAIVSLSLMGSDGSEQLAEIAEHHSDEGLRALAGIAIGQPLGHTHQPKR